MASKLRIFVCEFITGGGLYRAPLPASLAREGGVMLEALLADLIDLPGVEVITTRDPRLPPLAVPVKVILADGNPWLLWEHCMAGADLLWPIAPESGGALERLSVMACSARLLGCRPHAVRIAASKHATAAHLAQHGIAVVPTLRPSDPMPRAACAVAKPDDGVGCEDTRRFDDLGELRRWLEAGRSASHVVQPWLEGEPASLSMLCLEGRSQLLSCNRQLVEVSREDIRYRGSVLNDMAIHWAAFDTVATQVAQALPGLAGYVGVDVIVNAGKVTVLEINPRLTTSYAGMRRAIGCNPAGLVLDLLYNGRMTEAAALQRNRVEVTLDG